MYVFSESAFAAAHTTSVVSRELARANQLLALEKSECFAAPQAEATVRVWDPDPDVLQGFGEPQRRPTIHDRSTTMPYVTEIVVHTRGAHVG